MPPNEESPLCTNVVRDGCRMCQRGEFEILAQLSRLETSSHNTTWQNCQQPTTPFPAPTKHSPYAGYPPLCVLTTSPLQKMAPATKKSAAGAKKGQKVTKKFIINCSQPVNDKIFDIQAFEKFLHDRIKVEGRTGNLGDVVQISQQGDGKIEVIAHQEFSGRYLKYLTKKFLKKQQLRDWLRVVSTSKGVYELRFFNVVNDEADEDDE